LTLSLAQTWLIRDEQGEMRGEIYSYSYNTPEAERQGRPPMVQRSGRFKTTHTGCYLSAKAYGAVRRFETTLYGALFRGQSNKRYLHAHQSVFFMYNPKAKLRGHVLN
jgi:ribosomal protein L35